MEKLHLLQNHCAMARGRQEQSGQTGVSDVKKRNEKEESGLSLKEISRQTDVEQSKRKPPLPVDVIRRFWGYLEYHSHEPGIEEVRMAYREGDHEKKGDS